MADAEQDLGADAAADTGDTSAAAETGDTSGTDVADDFPTVEPAPEPDNPRYSTEHEVPEGEPQPLPNAEG